MLLWFVMRYFSVLVEMHVPQARFKVFFSISCEPQMIQLSKKNDKCTTYI
jgi:hypothetical protein